MVTVPGFVVGPGFLTPRVAESVGTIQEAVPSFAQQHQLARFYFCPEVGLPLPGLGLPSEVAPHIAVAGAIWSDAIAAAEPRQNRCMVDRLFCTLRILSRSAASSAWVQLTRSRPCLAGPSITQRRRTSAKWGGMAGGRLLALPALRAACLSAR